MIVQFEDFQSKLQKYLWNVTVYAGRAQGKPMIHFPKQKLLLLVLDVQE